MSSMRSRPDRQRQDRRRCRREVRRHRNVVLKRRKLARRQPGHSCRSTVTIRSRSNASWPSPVTDDHARQEKALEKPARLGQDQRARIRDHLTEHEIDAGDRRVRLVTLKAYEKAAALSARDPVRRRQ